MGFYGPHLYEAVTVCSQVIVYEWFIHFPDNLAPQRY